MRQHQDGAAVRDPAKMWRVGNPANFLEHERWRWGHSLPLPQHVLFECSGLGVAHDLVWGLGMI